MARRDVGRVRAVLDSAVARLRPWLADLRTEDLFRPSVLTGWSVGDLAAHLVLVADSVVALRPAERGTVALGVADYVGSYAAGADVIADRTRAAAGGPRRSTSVLLAAFEDGWSSAAAHLDELGDHDQAVAARRGPILLTDFLATRVLECVVHGDDLARSVPEREPPDLAVDATRVAVRLLLDVLAERAPGRSVEMRVPPLAAVQCVPGPVHTRGTPANVVETDPRTWLQVAAGRLDLAEAQRQGRWSASGDKSDLAAWLPVL